MNRLKTFTGTFKDFPYERPDCEKLAAEMAEKVEIIRNAATYDEAKKAFLEFQDIDEWIFSMETVTFLRHMIDTRDTFYDQEMHYFNVTRAERTNIYSTYYDVMIHSAFRPQFEADFGTNLVSLMEMFNKTKNPDVISELSRKSDLGSQYQKIIGNCSTEFRGKQVNFYGLMSVV